MKKVPLPAIITGVLMGLIFGLAYEYGTSWLFFPTFLFFSLSVGTIAGVFLQLILFIIRRRKVTAPPALGQLPQPVASFLTAVIRKMHYRRTVRKEVFNELVVHFEDELKDCKTDEEKQLKAQKVIEDFGDPALLGNLLRSAKKRCRPLWQKAVIFSLSTAGAMLALYFIIFLTGRPAITINYIAEMNRLARPLADESQNAAPFYQQAAGIMANEPNDIKELAGKKFTELTDANKERLENFFSEKSELFDLLKTGTEKRYYWPTYESKSSSYDVMSCLMFPGLGDFRRIAQLLCLRCQLSGEKGKFEEALKDIEICYKFGSHIKTGTKSIIEQLVGIAIQALSTGTLRKILSEYEVEPQLLIQLQSEMEKTIAQGNFFINIEFEKLFMYDEIQRCFSADGLAGGRLCLAGMQRISELGDNRPRSWFELVSYGMAAPVLFAQPDKKQTRQMADRLYEFYEKMRNKSPYQLHCENIDIEKEMTKMTKGNILIRMLAPALGKVIEISYRNRTDSYAALTIIALQRYKNEKGQYPSSLNDLVTAGFMKELPIDPWSDKPLVYKKTDTGFTLYSIGKNFVDDGGVMGTDDKGKTRMWAENGDDVFWPVMK